MATEGSRRSISNEAFNEIRDIEYRLAEWELTDAERVEYECRVRELRGLEPARGPQESRED